MVPVLCAHLIQDWILLTICFKRDRQREKNRDATECTCFECVNIKERYPLMLYLLSKTEQNHDIFYHIFPQIKSEKNNPTCFFFAFLFLGPSQCHRASASARIFVVFTVLQLRWVPLSPDVVYPIIWAPRCWADCKLILSVGMSILLTFKPQGTIDMLAVKIEYMQLERYREQYSSKIWRWCLKSLVSSTKWACEAEGWPALRVTDVWYVWRGLAKSLFLHFLCHWSSESSDNSPVYKLYAGCEASKQQKWRLSNLCIYP